MYRNPFRRSLPLALLLACFGFIFPACSSVRLSAPASEAYVDDATAKVSADVVQLRADVDEARAASAAAFDKATAEGKSTAEAMRAAIVAELGVANVKAAEADRKAREALADAGDKVTPTEGILGAVLAAVAAYFGVNVVRNRSSVSRVSTALAQLSPASGPRAT